MDEDPFGPEFVPAAPYRLSEVRPIPDDDNCSNDGFGTILPPPEEAVESDVDLKLQSGLHATIRNVVATFNMRCRVNLREISQRARNAEYNPRRFTALVLRIREPKATALIFASGKGVCTGAKDETSCKLAARKFARIVQRLGYDATFQDFKIQNIVATLDVGFTIFLERLNLVPGFPNMYEPEIFPGMIYRMPRPKLVFLIFLSGKVVMTGAKVREQIFEGFEKLYPFLLEYRKVIPPDAQQLPRS